MEITLMNSVVNFINHFLVQRKKIIFIIIWDILSLFYSKKYFNSLLVSNSS